MSEMPVRLNTSGNIAKACKVPPNRVSYVLATRPHIKPVALAGNTRLYDMKGVAQIRHELNAIAAKRASCKETA